MIKIIQVFILSSAVVVGWLYYNAEVIRMKSSVESRAEDFRRHKPLQHLHLQFDERLNGIDQGQRLIFCSSYQSSNVSLDTNQLFQSPMLEMDMDSGFFVIKNDKKSKPVVPNVNLVSVTQFPFRYQLSGFVEKDFGSKKELILLLHDSDEDKIIRVHSDYISEIFSGYVVKSVQSHRKVNNKGAVHLVTHLCISNGIKDYVLSSDNRTMSEDFEVVIRIFGQDFTFNAQSKSAKVGDFYIEWMEDDSEYPQFSFQISNRSFETPQSVTLKYTPPDT